MLARAYRRRKHCALRLRRKPRQVACSHRPFEGQPVTLTLLHLPTILLPLPTMMGTLAAPSHLRKLPAATLDSPTSRLDHVQPSLPLPICPRHPRLSHQRDLWTIQMILLDARAARVPSAKVVAPRLLVVRPARPNVALLATFNPAGFSQHHQARVKRFPSTSIRDHCGVPANKFRMHSKRS